MFEYNKSLVGNAKHLRKNMTDEEKRLWYDCLSKLPIPAKRQKTSEIIFWISTSHRQRSPLRWMAYSTRKKSHAEKDAERDEALRALGITVLRYRNIDVNKNFPAVTQDIIEAIKAKGIEI